MTVLGETVLPLNTVIAESEWTLVDIAGAFTPPYAYGPTQVVRYGTSRWACKLVWRNLSPENRHLLLRFAASAGRTRAFWVSDYSHNLRGSLASSELITSPLSAAYWSPGTNRAVTADSGGVRNTRTGATTSAGLGLASALTVVANAPYAWRFIVEQGACGSMTIGASAGTTAFGTTYGSLAQSAPGRKVLRCAPTGTSMYVAVTDTVNLNANWAQQGWYTVREPSCVRSFLVDGGTSPTTQTGSKLYVQGLPTSTAGLMKAGDMVEIVSAGFAQMVRLTEDLNSDSSGDGYIVFEPQLRGAVSNNDLIVPVKPMVKMMLAEEPSIVTRPGWYSDVELNLVEAF